jgi:hypothetical protein
VTLDGSASFDVDGDPLEYAWSFVTVPAGSETALAGAGTPNPTFTPDRKGDYVVQLIVNDGTVDSAPDTVVVTIGNRPPVANAGPDQSLFLSLIGQFPAVLVTLDGSESSDPDGDALNYVWTFVSVPPGSAAALANAGSVNPTFTADRKGDYTIQLIVNDGTVDSAPDTVVVTIGNRPPVADAGPDQSTFLDVVLQQKAPIVLDGSGSFDPDGDSLTYAWTIVTRPQGSICELAGADTVAPTFVPDRKGDFVIQLIVHDYALASDPDTVVVTVENRPPVANAGLDQGVVLDSLVTLDGSGSSDIDGDSLTFAWTILTAPAGSGAALTGAGTVSPTFTADRKGVYVIELIVNDGDDDSAPDEVVVTVVNRPPTAVGVVLPDYVVEGNVFRNTDDPELTPNLDTLYALPRRPQELGKAFWSPLNLMQLDPDTAAIDAETPITLIMTEDSYLIPIALYAGKGLAVDPTTGEMWAIIEFVRVDTYSIYTALVRVNPHTGVAVPVGDPIAAPLSYLYAGLAVDLESIVYGVTGNGGGEKAVDTLHALYEIDTSDTSETFVIEFPEPGEDRTPGEVIAFNTDDGLLYHATGDSEGVPAGRLFRALDLTIPALTGVTLTTGEDSWRRPTAMTYAPGTSQFYLADSGGDFPGLFRMTLAGGAATEEFIGDIMHDPPYYEPPIKGLAFRYDRTFPAPEVTLDASQSSDPDGDDLAVSWEFVSVPPGSALDNGDLTNPSGWTTSFTPDLLGTYVLEVVVNDGEVDSVPTTVTVNYLNMQPVADAGDDQVFRGGYYPPVQLNGGDSYDPDGETLTFAWTFLSVPAGSNVEDVWLSPDASYAAPSFYADIASETEPYVLQLTVTDADGDTSTDTVELLAIEAPPQAD